MEKENKKTEDARTVADISEGRVSVSVSAAVTDVVAFGLDEFVERVKDLSAKKGKVTLIGARVATMGVVDEPVPNPQGEVVTAYLREP